VMSVDQIVQVDRWARQETLRLAGLEEE